MTPKQTAENFINSFIELNQQYSSMSGEEYGMNYDYHKKCAILMVNQIIQNYEFDVIALTDSDKESIGYKCVMDNLNYWDEVLTELYKL